MEQLSNSSKHFVVLLISAFTSVVVWAQDSLSDIDVELESTIIDKGPFYAQLWFWVVVGIVFLLILILLIRGGGSKKVKALKTEQEESKQEQEQKE